MNNQKYLIAANWKQNGDSKSLIKLINDFIKSYKKIKPRCEILILPPSIYLNAISNRLSHHRIPRKKISLGSQNISSFENGAYTGELSVDMTKDYNCNYTLVGHSDNRGEGDTDAMLKAKVQFAISANGVLVIDKMKMVNAGGLGAELKDFDFKGVRYVITSYRLSGVYKGEQMKEDTKGPQFTSKMINIIKNTKSGNAITISNIKAKRVDAKNTAIRVLDTLVIEIK